MKYYVLGHGSCYDGMCSLWVARRQFNNTFPGITKVKYHSVYYGQPLPRIEDGSVVIFLDFSIPREDLIALKERMARVIVLDHHESARNALAGIEDCTFDMTKSGAQLTTEFFKERDPYVLRIVNYVADRDLWKHQLYRTEDVNNFIGTLPNVYTDDAFVAWEGLIDKSHGMDPWVTELANKGNYITKYRTKLVAAAASRSFDAEIGDLSIKCVNTIPEIVSDVLNSLINVDTPVALGYFDSGLGPYVCSLRSNGAVNVARIAESFGGGGHPRAAGFTLTDNPKVLFSKNKAEKQIQPVI